ncbi:hypothetical protein VNO80_26260 [Phaseolus coccineus]|uniref:Uncharacterized protein n=1 Tax=Phaseolus coccineus TaxID=3886 RepID=A0AAN9QKB0_PHACN
MVGFGGGVKVGLVMELDETTSFGRGGGGVKKVRIPVISEVEQREFVLLGRVCIKWKRAEKPKQIRCLQVLSPKQ